MPLNEYQKRIEAGRDASLTLSAKSAHDLREYLAQYAAEIEARIRSRRAGPFDAQRRREVQQMIAELDAAMGNRFFYWRDVSARSMSEIHARATVKALDDAGYEPNGIGSRMSGIGSQITQAYLSRGGTAQSFKSTRRKFHREVDRVISQGMARGGDTNWIARQLRVYIGGADAIPENLLMDRRTIGQRTLQEFMGYANPTPFDVAQVRKLARGISDKAQLIARTEVMNAELEVGAQAAAVSPLVESVDWWLSRRHDEKDECDALADYDWYGLGPGRYPSDAVPARPHPRCLCGRTHNLRDPKDWGSDKPPSPKQRISVRDVATDLGLGRSHRQALEFAVHQAYVRQLALPSQARYYAPSVAKGLLVGLGEEAAREVAKGLAKHVVKTAARGGTAAARKAYVAYRLIAVGHGPEPFEQIMEEVRRAALLREQMRARARVLDNVPPDVGLGREAGEFHGARASIRRTDADAPGTTQDQWSWLYRPKHRDANGKLVYRPPTEPPTPPVWTNTPEGLVASVSYRDNELSEWLLRQQNEYVFSFDEQQRVFYGVQGGLEQVVVSGAEQNSFLFRKPLLHAHSLHTKARPIDGVRRRADFSHRIDVPPSHADWELALRMEAPSLFVDTPYARYWVNPPHDLTERPAGWGHRLWYHGIDEINDGKPMGLEAFDLFDDEYVALGARYRLVEMDNDADIDLFMRAQEIGGLDPDSAPSGFKLLYSQDSIDGTDDIYQQIYEVLLVDADGDVVARLPYYLDGKRNAAVLAGQLTVREKYRRRGIGSLLMDAMRRRHPEMTIDPVSFTDLGEQFWKAYLAGEPRSEFRLVLSDVEAEAMARQLAWPELAKRYGYSYERVSWDTPRVWDDHFYGELSEQAFENWLTANTVSADVAVAEEARRTWALYSMFADADLDDVSFHGFGANANLDEILKAILKKDPDANVLGSGSVGWLDRLMLPDLDAVRERFGIPLRSSWRTPIWARGIVDWDSRKFEKKVSDALAALDEVTDAAQLRKLMDDALRKVRLEPEDKLYDLWRDALTNDTLHRLARSPRRLVKRKPWPAFLTATRPDDDVFEQNLARALHWMIGQKDEHSVTLDPLGNIVSFRRGNPLHVETGWIATIRQWAQARVLHYHPTFVGEFSFSLQDLQTFFTTQSRGWWVATRNRLYVVKPKPNQRVDRLRWTLGPDEAGRERLTKLAAEYGGAFEARVAELLETDSLVFGETILDHTKAATDGFGAQLYRELKKYHTARITRERVVVWDEAARARLPAQERALSLLKEEAEGLASQATVRDIAVTYDLVYGQTDLDSLIIGGQRFARWTEFAVQRPMPRIVSAFRELQVAVRAGDFKLETQLALREWMTETKLLFFAHPDSGHHPDFIDELGKQLEEFWDAGGRERFMARVLEDDESPFRRRLRKAAEDAETWTELVRERIQSDMARAGDVVSTFNTTLETGVSQGIVSFGKALDKVQEAASELFPQLRAMNLPTRRIDGADIPYFPFDRSRRLGYKIVETYDENFVRRYLHRFRGEFTVQFTDDGKIKRALIDHVRDFQTKGKKVMYSQGYDREVNSAIEGFKKHMVQRQVARDTVAEFRDRIVRGIAVTLDPDLQRQIDAPFFPWSHLARESEDLDDVVAILSEAEWDDGYFQYMTDWFHARRGTLDLEPTRIRDMVEDYSLYYPTKEVIDLANKRAQELFDTRWVPSLVTYDPSAIPDAIMGAGRQQWAYEELVRAVRDLRNTFGGVAGFRFTKLTDHLKKFEYNNLAFEYAFDPVLARFHRDLISEVDDWLVTAADGSYVGMRTRILTPDEVQEAYETAQEAFAYLKDVAEKSDTIYWNIGVDPDNALDTLVSGDFFRLIQVDGAAGVSAHETLLAHAQILAKRNELDRALRTLQAAADAAPLTAEYANSIQQVRNLYSDVFQVTTYRKTVERLLTAPDYDTKLVEVLKAGIGDGVEITEFQSAEYLIDLIRQIREDELRVLERTVFSGDPEWDGLLDLYALNAQYKSLIDDHGFKFSYYDGGANLTRVQRDQMLDWVDDTLKIMRESGRISDAQYAAVMEGETVEAMRELLRFMQLDPDVVPDAKLASVTLGDELAVATETFDDLSDDLFKELQYVTGADDVFVAYQEYARLYAKTEEYTAGLIRRWAASSSGDVQGIAIQKAIQYELGVDRPAFKHMGRSVPGGYHPVDPKDPSWKWSPTEELKGLESERLKISVAVAEKTKDLKRLETADQDVRFRTETRKSLVDDFVRSHPSAIELDGGMVLRSEVPRLIKRDLWLKNAEVARRVRNDMRTLSRNATKQDAIVRRRLVSVADKTNATKPIPLWESSLRFTKADRTHEVARQKQLRTLVDEWLVERGQLDLSYNTPVLSATEYRGISEGVDIDWMPESAQEQVRSLWAKSREAGIKELEVLIPGIDASDDTWRVMANLYWSHANAVTPKAEQLSDAIRLQLVEMFMDRDNRRAIQRAMVQDYHLATTAFQEGTEELFDKVLPIWAREKRDEAIKTVRGALEAYTDEMASLERQIDDLMARYGQPLTDAEIDVAVPGFTAARDAVERARKTPELNAFMAKARQSWPFVWRAATQEVVDAITENKASRIGDALAKLNTHLVNRRDGVERMLAVHRWESDLLAVFREKLGASSREAGTLWSALPASVQKSLREYEATVVRRVYPEVRHWADAYSDLLAGGTEAMPIGVYEPLWYFSPERSKATDPWWLRLAEMTNDVIDMERGFPTFVRMKLESQYLDAALKPLTMAEERIAMRGLGLNHTKWYMPLAEPEAVSFSVTVRAIAKNKENLGRAWFHELGKLMQEVVDGQNPFGTYSPALFGEAGSETALVLQQRIKARLLDQMNKGRDVTFSTEYGLLAGKDIPEALAKLEGEQLAEFLATLDEAAEDAAEAIVMLMRPEAETVARNLLYVYARELKTMTQLQAAELATAWRKQERLDRLTELLTDSEELLQLQLQINVNSKNVQKLEDQFAAMQAALSQWVQTTKAGQKHVIPLAKDWGVDIKIVKQKELNIAFEEMREMRARMHEQAFTIFKDHEELLRTSIRSIYEATQKDLRFVGGRLAENFDEALEFAAGYAERAGYDAIEFVTETVEDVAGVAGELAPGTAPPGWALKVSRTDAKFYPPREEAMYRLELLDDTGKDVASINWMIHPDRPDQITLTSFIVVDEDLQGRGIGQLLLDKLQYEHPDAVIRPGAMTDAGKGLWAKWQRGEPRREFRLVAPVEDAPSRWVGTEADARAAQTVRVAGSEPITFDPTAQGSPAWTSQSQNVNYEGGVIYLTPREFLRLAAKKESPNQNSLKIIRESLDKGEPMIPGWLDIDFDRGRVPVVVGHEGRHRAMVLIERGYGDTPVPYQVYARPHMKAADWDAEDVVDRLAVLTPERGAADTSAVVLSGKRVIHDSQWKRVPEADDSQRLFLLDEDDVTRNSWEVTDEVREEMADAAQTVYDEWDQVDGVDEVYGTGGICDEVAEQMAEKLAERGFNVIPYGQEGGEHQWLLLRTRDGIYELDIPYERYEYGGGYSWTKKPGVYLTKDDVVMNRLSNDPFDPDFADIFDYPESAPPKPIPAPEPPSDFMAAAREARPTAFDNTLEVVHLVDQAEFIAPDGTLYAIRGKATGIAALQSHERALKRAMDVELDEFFERGGIRVAGDGYLQLKYAPTPAQRTAILLLSEERELSTPHNPRIVLDTGTKSAEIGAGGKKYVMRGLDVAIDNLNLKTLPLVDRRLPGERLEAVAYQHRVTKEVVWDETLTKIHAELEQTLKGNKSDWVAGFRSTKGRFFDRDESRLFLKPERDKRVEIPKAEDFFGEGYAFEGLLRNYNPFGQDVIPAVAGPEYPTGPRTITVRDIRVINESGYALKTKRVLVEGTDEFEEVVGVRWLKEGDEWMVTEPVDAIPLFRGIRFQNPEDVRKLAGDIGSGKTVDLQPANSFSVGLHTATGFTDGTGGEALIYLYNVPKERILCYPGTGFGCFSESEVVVLGGKSRLLSTRFHTHADAELELIGRLWNLGLIDDDELIERVYVWARTREAAYEHYTPNMNDLNVLPFDEPQIEKYRQAISKKRLEWAADDDDLNLLGQRLSWIENQVEDEQVMMARLIRDKNEGLGSLSEESKNAIAWIDALIEESPDDWPVQLADWVNKTSKGILLNDWDNVPAMAVSYHTGSNRAEQWIRDAINGAARGDPVLDFYTYKTVANDLAITQLGELEMLVAKQRARLKEATDRFDALQKRLRQLEKAREEGVWGQLLIDEYETLKGYEAQYDLKYDQDLLETYQEKIKRIAAFQSILEDAWDDIKIMVDKFQKGDDYSIWQYVYDRYELSIRKQLGDAWWSKPGGPELWEGRPSGLVSYADGALSAGNIDWDELLDIPLMRQRLWDDEAFRQTFRELVYNDLRDNDLLPPPDGTLSPLWQEDFAFWYRWVLDLDDAKKIWKTVEKEVRKALLEANLAELNLTPEQQEKIMAALIKKLIRDDLNIALAGG